MTHSASTPASSIQLLLLLLHMVPDEGTHQAVTQLVETGIDWDVFFDLTLEHRVLPLIQKRVQTHYTDIFPIDIQEDLADEVFDNTARNMVLSNKLLAAIALLKDHGIPAIAFKGPILATMIYGDISQRMFSDLDILVPSDRFLKAKAILIQAGYQTDIHSLFLITSEQQENQLLCELGECPLSSPNSIVHIDLHQRLVAGDFFQMAHPLDPGIWQQPHSPELLGTPVPTMGVEDLLLYLCIHGTKDLWKRLSWVCDVAALLHSSPPLRQPIQWDIVLKKARAHHLESMVWFSLILVESLLGVPFPSEAQALKASHSHHQGLLDETLNRLSQTLPTEDQRFSLAARFRFRLRLLDHPKDRWLCAIAFYKTLVTPTYADTQFVHFPPVLHGLYSIIRPFRLGKEWLAPTQPPKISVDAEP